MQFEMEIMVKSYMAGGLITAAIFAGVTGCSRTPAQTPSTNVFAPAPVATGPVSEPIITAIPVANPSNVAYSPSPVQPDIYQPVVVPPMQQAQVTPLQPAPLIAPTIVGNEAPLPAPSFDCNNIPTSKSGLTRYRKSCL